MRKTFHDRATFLILSGPSYCLSSPHTPVKTRETYIDNIRVALTALVVLHHAAVTYGAPGSWYYSEPAQGLLPRLLLTVFVSTNQAFFMGFFFLLSAYFIPASYARKGRWQFMADRLKRLGIPIVFYSLVLTPVMIYALVRLHLNEPVTWHHVFFERNEWVTLGVLWFTAALLLFTCLYWIAKPFLDRRADHPRPMPGNTTIFVFAVGLGLISFIVRIFFPIGWTLDPLGFQLGHFPQYIALFTVGIVAFKNRWLSSITEDQGRLWLRVAGLLLGVGFPFLYFLKELRGAGLDAFLGGLTVEALSNAVWEQLLGVAMIMAWLGIGRQWNVQGRFLQELSRSAYAVYVIHPLVLLLVALMMKDIDVPVLLKFLVTGSLSVAGSFAAGWLLVRLPLVNKVL